MAVVQTFSKRSTILIRALPYIDTDDWDEDGDYIVFGPDPSGALVLLESNEARSPQSASDSQSRSAEKILEFAKALLAFRADQISKEQTTLKGRPDGAELLEKARAIPAEAFRRMAASILGAEDIAGSELTPESFVKRLKEQGIKSDHGTGSGDSIPGHVIECLDIYYSREVLDKLEEIVSRASALDKISLAQLPGPRVRRCFEEAMHCYLYGFNMACAAMCRGLLEAALVEVIDPQERLRPTVEDRKKGGRRASYFLKLVDNARLGGRVSKVLSEPGGPADQVKEAGDAAVHDAAVFASKFPARKVEWLLDRTRQILLELYYEPASKK